MVDGNTKLCPVCDSEIDARAERCRFCDTDLSLFDFGTEEEPEGGGIEPGVDETIDQLLADIVGTGEEKEDILEGIRELGRNGPPAEAAPEVEAAVPPEPVEFECPNCGAAVAEDAASCSECGVEFAEDAAEFECPVCNNPVEAAASACPSCGVEFAAPEDVEAPPPPEPVAEAPPDEEFEDLIPDDLLNEGTAEEIADAAMEEATADVERALSFDEGEAVLVMEEEEAPPQEPEAPPPPPEVAPAAMELGLLTRTRDSRLRARETEDMVTGEAQDLYNQLPKLVSEVKPMLLQARTMGVEIGDTKDLINQAIAAGKARDIREAVRLVKRSKRKLKDYFSLQLAYRIESLHKEVMEAKAKGGETGEAEDLVKSAVALLEGEHYEAAHNEIEEAKESFSKLAGGYYEASKEIRSVRGLLESAGDFDIDLSEAEGLLRKSEEAQEKQEWDVSLLYAKQARDRVLRELPTRLRVEMQQARKSLMDLKVQGRDLSKPIGILKQASISLKKKAYGDALKYVQMFRAEVARETSGS